MKFTVENQKDAAPHIGARVRSDLCGAQITGTFVGYWQPVFFVPKGYSLEPLEVSVAYPFRLENVSYSDRWACQAIAVDNMQLIKE